MENYEIKRVRHYLDIQADSKRVRNIYLPLAGFEFLCLLGYSCDVKNLLILIAVIVFFCMYIWGETMCENDKNLFLYLGVGISLWAFFCILLVLEIVHADFYQGVTIFAGIIMLLVPASIWLVKKMRKKY